jgi:DNA-binding response OmpR family regulator
VVTRRAEPGDRSSGDPARILVVEDDPRVRELLAEELATAGHRVTTVATAADALFHAEEASFDLMVLDLGLPDGDGVEVAERLQGRCDLPIVMLTARADVESRVRGLYAGAADYVAKPFSLPELLARIHVRLRERSGPARPRHADLSLDPDTATALGPGGEVDLSERELALLRLLVEHPGRLLSRDDLERRLYGPDEVPGSNTVEVFVHHLRRKLDRIGVEPRIRTVRGKGYMLR